MKTILLPISLAAGLAMMASPAKAQVTFSGTGHVNGSAAADGGALSSVVVNNDANNITFTLNSTQPMASYIFYSVEIQIAGQAGNGYTGLINPWGEHFGLSTGENALINTYGSGATPLLYSGGNWVQGAGTGYAAGGTGFNFATITVPLNSLGLNVGNSFYFDVISSYANPGGQSAYGALDAIGWPAETDNSYTPWNGASSPNYYDSATDAGGSTFGTAASEYVVQVPEPEALALAACGSCLIVLLRRRA